MSVRGRDLDDDDDAPLDSGAWGRPGGDWAGMRPTIDNPFTWSLPLLRVAGITVRIHLLFLVFVIVQLSRALAPAQGQVADFTLTALSMAVLFVVVLAHEFGHCLACRLVRGDVDEILMWPLGGLAVCHPPRHWRAHLLTALGGPLVNVLILALAAPLLYMATGQWAGLAFPNPLDPLAELRDPRIARSWAHITLFMFNALSMMLLAFNLLPLFPLDGGRIVQSALWPRLGWSRSMRLAVRAGYLTGMSLGIFGAVTNNWPLIAVAIFGLWSCYATHRQLEFSDNVLGDEADDFAMSLEDDDLEQAELDADAESAADSARTSTHSAGTTTAKRRADAEAVDDILQKIVDAGLESLTPEERAILERETQRKRKGG